MIRRASAFAQSQVSRGDTLPLLKGNRREGRDCGEERAGAVASWSGGQGVSLHFLSHGRARRAIIPV
jgi:hypothetical protein